MIPQAITGFGIGMILASGWDYRTKITSGEVEIYSQTYSCEVKK